MYQKNLMNPASSIAHHIVRIVISLLMISGMMTLTRFALLPFIFGGTSYYWFFVSWAILLGAIFSTIGACLLSFKGGSTIRSLRETGLAAISVISAFLFTVALFPSVLPFNGDSSRYMMTISAAAYLLSAAILLFMLARGFVFSSTLSKVSFALCTLLSGLLFLFAALPLIQRLFGFRLPTDGAFAVGAQLGIYLTIVLFCTLVGLLLVIGIRKFRRPTPVKSDSHLIE